MDRRRLIMIVSLLGGFAAIAAMLSAADFALLLFVAFIVGGMSNPLYSLMIAHTNDFLDPTDMAAASGGLMFFTGMGAITGPLISGWLMGQVGTSGYWLLMAVLMLLVSAYAAYRMTQRPATPVNETGAYIKVVPSASHVALEAAQEWAVEAAEDDKSETTEP